MANCYFHPCRLGQAKIFPTKTSHNLKGQCTGTAFMWSHRFLFLLRMLAYNEHAWEILSVAYSHAQAVARYFRFLMWTILNIVIESVWYTYNRLNREQYGKELNNVSLHMLLVMAPPTAINLPKKLNHWWKQQYHYYLFHLFPFQKFYVSFIVSQI